MGTRNSSAPLAGVFVRLDLPLQLCHFVFNGVLLQGGAQADVENCLRPVCVFRCI